jgi:histidine triad (HIT) family protein
MQKKYDTDNIFAHIIKGEITCTKVYEDKTILAFNDLYPAATVHVLVIPKKEYISFNDFIVKANAEEITHFFTTVQKIAKSLGLDKTGYRIVSNHGSDAMQTIPHFHIHILGKEPLGAMTGRDNWHK